MWAWRPHKSGGTALGTTATSPPTGVAGTPTMLRVCVRVYGDVNIVCCRWKDCTAIHATTDWVCVQEACATRNATAHITRACMCSLYTWGSCSLSCERRSDCNHKRRFIMSFKCILITPILIHRILGLLQCAGYQTNVKNSHEDLCIVIFTRFFTCRSFSAYSESDIVKTQNNPKTVLRDYPGSMAISAKFEINNTRGQTNLRSGMDLNLPSVLCSK